MKSLFDFSFLGKYGKVFQVFEAQDSGNICFKAVSDDRSQRQKSIEQFITEWRATK